MDERTVVVTDRLMKVIKDAVQKAANLIEGGRPFDPFLMMEGKEEQVDGSTVSRVSFEQKLFSNEDEAKRFILEIKDPYDLFVLCVDCPSEDGKERAIHLCAHQRGMNQNVFLVQWYRPKGWIRSASLLGDIKPVKAVDNSSIPSVIPKAWT